MLQKLMLGTSALSQRHVVRVAHGVESDDSHINSQTDQSSNAQRVYLRYFPSLLVANALS